MKIFNFTLLFGKASVFSVILLAACISAIIIDGGPKPGVEFTGGTEIHIKSPSSGSDVTEEEVRDLFVSYGYKPASIQRFGVKTDREFLVKFPVGRISPEEVGVFKNGLISAAEKTPHFQQIQILQIDYVGPNVGREFVKKAIIALLLGCVVILLYLIFRFEIGYATGAVVALLHDVLITMGFLAFADKEITLSIIAALLMVVGYSVNDTIVIFDRIRETLAGKDTDDFTSAVNLGITRTLSRTILTTITIFIVLVPLFFLGGSVIHDFAFTLMVGVIAGTYSSIFIATYFVVKMRKESVAK